MTLRSHQTANDAHRNYWKILQWPPLLRGGLQAPRGSDLPWTPTSNV